MQNNKDVAVKKTAEVPSTILYREDANKGFENVTEKSLKLPILKLLQNGSGEAQKRNQNYVEGAEPGMFLNTVTKKLYDGDKGIDVIPCYYDLEFQEWEEFGSGGQGRPINIFPSDSDILEKTTKDGAKDRLPNGNYILTCHQTFAIITDGNGSAEKVLISMSSSQAKIAKQWMSMQKSKTMTDAEGSYTPSCYSYIYNLSTVLNSGKGNQWYGYSVKDVDLLKDQNIYNQAKEFHDQMKAQKNR
jgi:hypothetical protein